MLSRGRVAIQVVFAGAVFISLMLVLFLFLCAWEIKLEADHIVEWLKKSKQVRPHYTWELVTHDGLSLGEEHKGPLKLALHPLIQPEVGSHEAYRRFRDMVKSGLSKNHVRFLDLEEVGQITDDMFLDAVHTDSAGHRLMAEIVARRIAQDHLLPTEDVQEVRSHEDAAMAPVDGAQTAPYIHR